MLVKAAKTYWGTFAGGLAIMSVVAVAGGLLGTGTTNDLLGVSARHRASSFADYLVSDPARLGALMTGVSRSSDIEAGVKTVASLSGIPSFTIFDAQGHEVFATRSAQHGWLLRDRPGGLTANRRISGEALNRPDNGWEIVADASGSVPSVALPLVRNGERVGFLLADIDLVGERVGYTKTLGWASSQLLAILFLATGAPALFYIRRKRRMEQADERIVFLANHDALTNVLNRRRMHEETDRILATARATRERMAMWFVDVDGLAEINDALGQARGDEVLRTVANRLADAVERNDLVARIGSDDFAILQRGVDSEEKLAALVRRITALMNEPIELGGDHKVTPRLSLGVALAPEHGRNCAELTKHAELAFLNQKSMRRGDYTVFHSSMDEELHERRAIERRLRHALAHDGFELFYQPIVCGHSHRLLGFEALIRLQDGSGGYISPVTFIPIAEARGSIKAIGNWVIEEACRQAALWPEHLFVSVNLSPVQFRDGDLVNTVQRALRAAGIPGSRIEIEVVESLLLERSEEILQQLAALKALGISVDMDDFGTGYSSLGYLWRFPFDKLKIDRSFMTALDEGQSSITRILETIISLAHHLGLKVTAEGIETDEQAEVLRTLGCDQLQGFLFGKPMPAERIASELLKGSAVRAVVGRPAPANARRAAVEAAE